MSGLRAVAVRLSDGRDVELKNALSIEVGASLSSPAMSMQGTFPVSEPPGKLGAVRVYGGGLLFEGRCDRQELRLSGQGMLLKLEARSKGALLLDNEATPCVLTNVHLGTVFSRCIAPYGFVCYNPNPGFLLSMYTVRKDTSEWEALAGFSRRAWGVTPYVAGDQVIVDRPRSSVPFTIANDGSGVSFSKLEHIYLPYRIVSEVVMRDEFGSYSAKVSNSSAAYHGVRRKRYVIPANEFVDDPGLDGNQRIRRSMLDSEQVAVTLPGLHQVRAGQEARVVDKAVQLYNLLVDEVTWVQDGAGVVTKLLLCSSVYY